MIANGVLNLRRIASISSAVFVLAMQATLSSCSKGGDSFSILADSKTFKQSTAYVAKPVDVLWVIDNSGSMKSSQDNLAANFQAFIGRFQQLNYDFHMGVTATDAYRANFTPVTPSRSRLRDGDHISGATHSGVFVMDKNTPNLTNTFITNVLLGVNGHGDERAFQSIEATLSNSLNNDFRRANAFLAIIIVSDEEDFSHSGTSMNESYTNPNLYPVSKYVTYLDGLTGSTATSRNYSVNTISIKDEACRVQLAINAQKIGQRLMELAAATGGTQGSLCGNFGETLDIISGQVLSLSTTFKLDREPIPESIEVIVNGARVPQHEQNGWTYDSSTNSLTFHGTGIPPADSDVSVNYDPKSVVI